MKDIIKNLTEKIESLTSDSYFYDMQIKFVANLKETSPEVEVVMDTTFDKIIEDDIKTKERILEKISALNVELSNFINQKAS